VQELCRIDCDIHPAVPAITALLPYLDDHWRDTVQQRGVHELHSIAYPDGAPITARPDWRPGSGPVRPAGSDLDRLRREALAPFGTRLAICNCLYGVHLLFSEDMAAAFARAVNDWVSREWLDREPRLRASIVVPLQNPELAVDEIERCAARGDRCASDGGQTRHRYKLALTPRCFNTGAAILVWPKNRRSSVTLPA